MNIGKMRHPVTIQKLELAQDEYGEMIESWQDLAKAWASIDTVSGNEFIAASGQNAQTTHRITMHYRGDLDPTMRIVSGGVNYKITALLPNNDRSILVVMCEVLV
jgi:SPP1 family predicted phage head-tail adaptor